MKNLFIALFIIISICSCQRKIEDKNDKTPIEIKNNLSLQRIVIKTIHGEFTIKFYSEGAPRTIERFTELVTSGFYNGLAFHRAIPNFLIQTGDPLGDGTGGSGVKLSLEINKHHHVLGTVGMAQSTEVNSADSQFYISLNTLPHLDGKYTVFGQVVEGIDVLKKISAGDKIISATLVN